MDGMEEQIIIIEPTKCAGKKKKNKFAPVSVDEDSDLSFCE